MRSALAVIAALCAVPTLADRPVTAEERRAIERTMAAEGCRGGSYEVEDDDGVLEGFEVDDARCENGTRVDFELTPEFEVLSRELED